MARPARSEYSSHFGTYIELVPEQEIKAALRSNFDAMLNLLSTVDEEQSQIEHPPYTWSTREVVGHICDTERIFAYRALRIARGDTTPLPGFDENAYARIAGYDARSLKSLTTEFSTIREATCSLFDGLGDDQDVWLRRGVASGVELTVRAIAYAICGHARHHLTILRKRFDGSSAL